MLAKLCLSLFSLFILANVAFADEQHHHDHEHMHEKESITAPTIKIAVSPINQQANQWQIKMTDIKNSKPVTLADLKEVHTEKIHLLIINDTLDDYSHVHPLALKEPGLYQFEWHPKTQGHYFIWADLMPAATNQQEYALSEVLLGAQKTPRVDTRVVMENTVDGYRFKLSFAKGDLKVGQADVGQIIVTDRSGKPVHDLEPIMGAFAHIVGFSEDLKSIVHIHPMGVEPTKITDRGGPELKFHIEPTDVGFIKLYLQVKIKGKEIFVPFGLMVL